ncbi:nuclear pore complex protein Nup214-like isoform X2 [Eriocheir sinensis]|uniref:nuclear pore complex protein Nup214-like isoform X2 n=1 Tax=Eriocheir sinensis TaxID=95602 RepID=UPI0021C81093|nr:nuclear pore complex protein Nup214-like isoform X2 [Eriocheir sinensis]
MEFGPDSEPNADVRFIANHIPVFNPEECSFPHGNCSLVATASKFGRIFVACGTQIKVFDSKTVWDDPAGSLLTTLSVGAQVTHVAASCDGLTLLVTVLHEHAPHALFYEIRGLVPGCGQQTPLLSMGLAGAGSQVHTLAWNPTDPGSVAVALSPSSLILLTLKENKVESKSENIEARALGWSPKGKQLTVGLEDGTLKLFKPDLTAVRNIQRPPMAEASAVLSVTWFNNTEFFIGYKSSAEEGAHVIMYVNAPKAKEPKFVAYEYVCNYNQGPRSPLFYPHYFPEWSLLCVMSSRAVAMAVLGRPGGSTEGWCEYEIDEGCIAAVHNVSITEETFPLGLAVDFTSQKTFTAKDNKVSGPCPVLYTLSTGGELNLFHIVNERPGAEALTKLPESLPATGLRTPQQFGRLASYPMNKTAPSSAPSTFSVPQTALPAAQTPMAPSPSPASQQKADTFSFNPPAQASSPFSASPLQTLSANFKPPQTQSSSVTTSLFPKSEPAASTSFFNVQGQNEGTKTTPAFPATPFKPPQIITTSQDFKFPNCPLPQPSTPAMSVNPAAKVDTKPPPVIITAVTPKATDTKPLSVGPPARPPQAVVAELDETLLSTIEAARVDFERELEDHKSMGDLPNQIGEQEEMGMLRCSLGEAAEWVDQMNSTTSELKGEVGQLHSEVLEGFTLAEEAEAQVNKKIKNPRHCQALQPQTLDPHSRKQMEEIRSRYQYLQSQLSEIDTRLHLDWAAYRNEQNKKKKKELPASETLYQALKKCHYARKVCERRVDSLCERIKDLHLHSLSGLATSQTNQDDDEILDNLEKSLRETSISAPSHMSPFKMLSPRKQESLQKALLQRNFIPLRKCSRSPRLDMSSLENLSPGHTPQGSHHSSYSANTGHSLMESFGPQTFSTPVRNNIDAAETKGISEASMTQTSDAISGAAAPKPQYEDITPPQTPDSRLTQSAKPTSPLRALSRLVSEVPTTTGTSDTKTPGIPMLPESKTAFRGFGDGGSTHGALKIPVTVASGPPLGAFKPVTSASLSKTTLAFPFTQFVPPSTVAQGSAAQQSMSQSLTGSSSLLFQPPPGASENASFPHTTSSEISQKTEVNSGMFFNPPASISESHTQASDKSETSTVPFSKPSSHPLASCSQEQSVFESAGNTSTPGPVNAPQTFTSMPLHSSTAETDSVSSSSSADSDTASNATVIGDNTEGQEPPAERLRDMATSQGGSLRAALDGSSTQQSNTAGLKQSGSNSQPSSFLATSGNLFGNSSGMMFGGSSSTNSGIFGAKTSIDAGKLAPSTTAVTTTSTTATVSMPTPTITSASLFMSPSTVSGGFFTGTAMTASESVVTTSTTVSSSLFGVQLTTSSKGLLGSSTSTATTVPMPVMTSATTSSTTLGTSTTASIFGGSKPTSGGTVFEVPTTSGGGIFGASSTTTGSVFGTVGTLSGSIFGTAGTAASTGNTFEASYANNKTSDGNLFGNTETDTDTASNVPTLISAASGSSNIFGTASTPATSSIFGLPTTAVSTTGSGSIFGISTTASGSIFGATSTSGSLFSTAATTSAGSIFKTPTSSGSEGIFGSSAGSTSGSSIFGTQAKTDATTPSIFGLAKNSTGSLFGGTAHSGTSTTSASTTTSTASASTSTTTSSAPVLTMGLFSAPPAGGSPSFNLSIPSGGGSATSGASTLFSSQTTTPATGASFSAGGIFSASSTTSSAFTSLTTSSSAFTSPSSSGAPSLTPGTIAAATTSSSVFGQGSQSTSGSVFGGAPSPQGPHFDGGGQGSGGFGTSTLGGSIFGGSGGQSLFGNTSSSSIFGQTSAANTPSPFSSVSTSKAESSPFGGSSVFGSGGGGGGGFFSGLGSKPTAESANKNVFGTTSLSNAAPQTSLFGNNNSTSPFQSSIFGGSNTSGSAGTGSFSGGSGPVANTGFAVTSPQTPQGFGGAATFGGSPSFGGGPTFGSPPRIASQSPVFGGSSTFSSPLSSSTDPTSPAGGGFSVFASSGGATFGSIAGSSGSGTSGGFGGFANQTNTPTFGSVAQQSNNQSSGDAFGAAAGTTFGSGSSFSSWR